MDRRTWVDPDRPGDNQGAVAAHGYHSTPLKNGLLGSRVVSVLDSGAVGSGSNRSREAVGKLFTPIVLLFTKQQNW